MAKQSSGSQYRRTSSSGGRTASTSGGRRTSTSTRRRTSSQANNVTFGFPWKKQNIIGIAAGVAVIILGYVLMGTAITADVAHNDGIWNNANAVTIGPILLTIGYCVIVPFFIFRRFGDDQTSDGEAA